MKITDRKRLLAAANDHFGTHGMSRYTSVSVADGQRGYAGRLVFRHVNGVGRHIVAIGEPGTLQEQNDGADFARPFISI